MTTPDKMYTHDLNPLRGFDKKYCLQATGSLVLEDGEVAEKGMVASFSAKGTLQLGLECDAHPIFLFRSSYSRDVKGDTGSSVGVIGVGGGGTSPRPLVMGFPGAAAMELGSNAYLPADESAMVPNALLTAYAPGTENAGMIKVGTKFVDTIIGQVSGTGVRNMGHGLDGVHFWPMFLPITGECPASSSSE